MIVVDPRFTRTAATADLFLQIRAGADIAFLGGLVNYALQNDRIARDYVVNFTNAAFIVKEGFKLPDDGLFSGFDGESQRYDQSPGNYEGAGQAGRAGQAGGDTRPPAGQTGLGHAGHGPLGAKAGGTLPPNVAFDPTLQHLRSVFQLLKQQYSRYTP